MLYTRDIIQSNTSLALWSTLISSKPCFSAESWACSSREPFLSCLSQRTGPEACGSGLSQLQVPTQIEVSTDTAAWAGRRLGVQGEGLQHCTLSTSAALHPLQPCSTAPSPVLQHCTLSRIAALRPLEPLGPAGPCTPPTKEPPGLCGHTDPRVASSGLSSRKKAESFPLFPTEVILDLWSTSFTKRVYCLNGWKLNPNAGKRCIFSYYLRLAEIYLQMNQLIFLGRETNQIPRASYHGKCFGMYSKCSFIK